MIYQLQLHLVQTNLMKVYINMNHTVILLYHHSDVSRLVYDKATLLLNSTITMRCRILLQVFLCIILLTLAESWVRLIRLPNVLYRMNKGSILDILNDNVLYSLIVNTS